MCESHPRVSREKVAGAGGMGSPAAMMQRQFVSAFYMQACVEREGEREGGGGGERERKVGLLP